MTAGAQEIIFSEIVFVNTIHHPLSLKLYHAENKS